MNKQGEAKWDPDIGLKRASSFSLLTPNGNRFSAKNATRSGRRSMKAKWHPFDLGRGRAVKREKMESLTLLTPDGGNLFRKRRRKERGCRVGSLEHEKTSSHEIDIQLYSRGESRRREKIYITFCFSREMRNSPSLTHLAFFSFLGYESAFWPNFPV